MQAELTSLLELVSHQRQEHEQQQQQQEQQLQQQPPPPPLDLLPSDQEQQQQQQQQQQQPPPPPLQQQQHQRLTAENSFAGYREAEEMPNTTMGIKSERENFGSAAVGQSVGIVGEQGISKQKKFSCSVEGCTEVFSESAAARRHANTHVNGSASTRPFVCGTCGQSFGVKATLTSHEALHAGEKPFKCDFGSCTRSFARKWHLKVHYRTHTDERPHGCTIPGCDKRFRDTSHLQRHMRNAAHSMEERARARANRGRRKKSQGDASAAASSSVAPHLTNGSALSVATSSAASPSVAVPSVTPSYSTIASASRTVNVVQNRVGQQPQTLGATAGPAHTALSSREQVSIPPPPPNMLSVPPPSELPGRNTTGPSLVNSWHMGTQHTSSGLASFPLPPPPNKSPNSHAGQSNMAVSAGDEASALPPPLPPFVPFARTGGASGTELPEQNSFNAAARHSAALQQHFQLEQLRQLARMFPYAMYPMTTAASNYPGNTNWPAMRQESGLDSLPRSSSAEPLDVLPSLDGLDSSTIPASRLPEPASVNSSMPTAASASDEGKDASEK